MIHFYFEREHRRGKRQIVQCITILFLALSWLSLSWAGPVMVDKNLFSPERSPMDSEPEAPQGPKAVFPVGQIQLDGVFIHGDVRKAILRVNPRLLQERGKSGPEAGKRAEPYMTVHEGQQIGEYRIGKIEPRGIRVTFNGSDYEIPLFAKGKVAPPPMPAVPVPVAPDIGVPVDPGQPGEVPTPQDDLSINTPQPNLETGSVGVPLIPGVNPSPDSAASPPSPPQTPVSPSSALPTDTSATSPATNAPQPSAPPAEPGNIVPPGVSLFDQMRKAIEDARQKGQLRE